MIIGTSGVPRWALLLEITGHSALAYASSSARISSFFMSTAQKTKSASAATSSTCEASYTGMAFMLSGIGVSIAQRPATASSYGLPAERGLAASTVTVNHGWFSSRVMKRCPTMPVQPTIPTRYCFMLFSFFFSAGGKKY